MSRSSTHLRLVPFNPNDYSLGEVLTKDTQALEQDPSAVNAVISLLMQWPEQADISLKIGEQTLPVKHLDYDREDRNPSELWLLLPVKEDISSREGCDALVRFQIFRQCYEFTTKIAAVTLTHDTQTPMLIIEAPNSIVFYKNRKLPRIATEIEALLLNPDSRTIECKVMELDLRGARITAKDSVATNCKLKIDNSTFDVRVIRKEGNTLVLKFCHETPIQSGELFDIYRIFSYKHLKRRQDFNSSDLLGLYSNTGYFSKFQTPEETERRCSELSTVWSNTVKAQHSLSADYVTATQDNQLTGASSTTLAFYKENKPIWVFHQLCALTSPDLLEHSGELYTWRAEYLAGRPEDLDVIAWFDSSSRWLERIYVKFAFHKNKSVSLKPVRIFRRSFDKSSCDEGCVVQQFHFGDLPRYVASTAIAFAGASPSFLNAAGILDSIVITSDQASDNDVDVIGNAISSKSNYSSRGLEITTSLDSSCINARDTDTPIIDVDRFCIFNKESLIDFIASVEHSVAVTQRKKSIGIRAEIA